MLKLFVTIKCFSFLGREKRKRNALYSQIQSQIFMTFDLNLTTEKLSPNIPYIQWERNNFLKSKEMDRNATKYKAWFT